MTMDTPSAIIVSNYWMIGRRRNLSLKKRHSQISMNIDFIQKTIEANRKSLSNMCFRQCMISCKGDTK